MSTNYGKYVWHNNKFIRWEDATIHVISHVIHYGSSGDLYLLCPYEKRERC